MKRRDFLLRGAALAGGAAFYRPARGWPILPGLGAGDDPTGVALVCHPSDAAAASAPVQRALKALKSALERRGQTVRVLPRPGDALEHELCVVVAGRDTAVARDSGLRLPQEAEAMALVPGALDERRVVFALGSDARGLAYALAELTDRVSTEGDAEPLVPGEGVVQRPANRVRSIIRLFTSDVEDKTWFNDRDFWRRYFAMLVSNRFNRLNLSFGLGYDQPQGLKDTYFYFAYPFLLSVPGYDVRATNLSATERDRNLEQLRFISDEAAAHGLDFQLGLWTHAYQWVDSPDANHVIEGLTPATQGPYCRDALALLLRECPNITSVTLRIHGESGVPEGSYDLWRTIFEGVKLGRAHDTQHPVLLDLHAKGIDQPTLDAALAVGVPVTLSPKFWAEHMGLPYHQADIRPTEIPTGRPGRGPFTHSEGDRSFTRYGYADLLREDRRYGIVHRIWPGTQRVLLWSDPAFAAAYGRTAGLCGSLGAEVFEPLSFKGRKGSGLPGGRDGYADLSVRAPGDDFEKYRLTYAAWGHGFYDPDAAPAAWTRRLGAEYGAAASSAGQVLSHAGRILPLLTTAHTPSAANNSFWPEMYVNMTLVEGEARLPYFDTPLPRRFGTVSPLDPQLFSRIEDFAEELLGGRVSAKYSPAEVAAWLEDLAGSTESSLELARKAADVRTPAFRRLDIDARVQSGLGRFFAWKLRAGVLYALFARTGDAGLHAAAIDAYGRAREHWVRIIGLTSGVYVKDMTYGPEWFQHGHWADRLAAIDKDIALVQQGTASANVALSADRAGQLRRSVLEPPARVPLRVSHAAPKAFTPRRSLELEVRFPGAGSTRAATLHYRHVNQGERWQQTSMRRAGAVFRGSIPAEYAEGVYPLQYYFEVAEGAQRWLWPALGPDLTRQPYVVVRPA